MRRLVSVLITIPFVLAHEGEQVEEHSTFKILLDNTQQFLSTHGMLLFGTIFCMGILVLCWWLWSQHKNT